MAEATSAQRYEAGVQPEATPEKKMASETAKFRAALHQDKNVIGGKIAPTVSLYKGEAAADSRRRLGDASGV